MTQNVIMDIVVAAILVLFVANGARKGLLKSIAGLVILIAALVGAAIFSNAVTPAVSKMVQPMLMEAVGEQLREMAENIDLSDITQNGVSLPEDITLPEGVTLPDGVTIPEGVTLPEGIDISNLLDSVGGTLEDIDLAAQLDGVLGELGLDADVAAGLVESAMEKATEAGISIVDALVQAVVETVVHALIFLLAFVVLNILLKILLGAMGLVLMLPGLRTLNAIGGAAVALVEGALLLFLLVWVARQCAVDVATLTEGTVLCQFFVNNTPLSVFSFL